MELMYKTMPKKKWYIILDDDTFVVKSALNLLLTHLSPDMPHYIGNAVGDYRGRFAHGGSAIIISGEAMRRLFGRRGIVKQAYRESLDEKWGDRLVATTFIKLGIYLEERYSHYFNGESPEGTKVTKDNFCSPVVSFHSLRTPKAMERVSDVFGSRPKPVNWGTLMELFKTPASMATGQDHVGPVDEKVKTWGKVRTGGDCQRKCDVEKWCLAWTYDGGKQECYGSPWMVPGIVEGVHGKASGFDGEIWKQLQATC